jgi:hypothetical protein
MLVSLLNDNLGDLESDHAKAHLSCRAVQAAKTDFDLAADAANEDRGEAKRVAEQFFRIEASVGMDCYMGFDQTRRLPKRSASGERKGLCCYNEKIVRFAALLAILSCSACAPSALLPYRPEQPPTVTLPLALAGIVDARSAFAAVFATELSATGASQSEQWLHGLESGQQPLTTLYGGSVATRFSKRAASTSVLIVGGLLDDCVSAQSVPFGDGIMRSPERSADEAYRQYDDLGLQSIRLVQVPGRASSEANGELLADAIRAEAAHPDVQRVVLIGYSKGVPDLLHALVRLQRDGGLPRSLVAVISVAGAVMGTPVADYYESAYDAISPLVKPLDCTPSRGGDLASVTRREQIAWLAANPPPPGPAYYSIIAHVPLEELSPALHWTGQLLASVDPRNDGQLVAADTVLPGSTLLAEARADHWNIALPLDRYPNPLVRAMAFEHSYPREALLRATLKWVIGSAP